MKYVILLLLLCANSAIAQKKTNPQYFIYNKDWKAAKDLQSAAFVVQTTNIGDSLFVNRVFKGRGHLMLQESYKDANEEVAHGAFAWYDDEGRIDSSGHVDNRKKVGSWAYYDDTLGVYLQIKYENGKEVERRDYGKKIIKTANSEKTFDDEKRENDNAKLAAVATKADEKEAYFKGGLEGYKRYLERSLNPPQDLVKTGVVKLQFIINKTGKLEDLHILRSVQLSADIEALRVITEMPDWTPAFQNGKNVYYQAIQHITFQLVAN